MGDYLSYKHILQNLYHAAKNLEPPLEKDLKYTPSSPWNSYNTKL